MRILGNSFITGRNAASGSLDADAQVYINAVASADGQALESGVQSAINDFVVGCKTDGIWGSIKACCILSGARTLSGALVPLVGIAPTNFNFVGADYNRRIGLKGNGVNKYLDTNRANNADPQNSNHNAIWVSQTFAPTGQSKAYMMSGTAAVSGRNVLIETSQSELLFANRFTTFSTITQQGSNPGFKGFSRADSLGITVRSASINTNSSSTSQSPNNTNVIIFAANNPSLNFFSDSRIGFYSIGESLNLQLLENRITALLNTYTLLP